MPDKVNLDAARNLEVKKPSRFTWRIAGAA
jgi:hypothetical protein